MEELFTIINGYVRLNRSCTLREFLQEVIATPFVKGDVFINRDDDTPIAIPYTFGSINIPVCEGFEKMLDCEVLAANAHMIQPGILSYAVSILEPEKSKKEVPQKPYHEQLVNLVKASGEEIIRRAKDLVGEGEEIADFKLELLFPLDSVPTIKVIREHVNIKGIEIILQPKLEKSVSVDGYGDESGMAPAT